MGRIVVNNLGKAYKLYPSRWARLFEWVTPFLGQRHQLQWVLRDINFRVEPGEAVGIIGVNGAGKSTLLKLITGTTLPSAGHVEISGRVAALLELGMGFHPDFTGRQNVFMAAQLLGIPSGQIHALMPEIEAFAEIGDYIDQPVRVYSSGMQMRLAFSVATAQRPNVLMVDEALSVGDAYFQHKSFDRIRAFRKAGTTLLLVSHDKAAIQSICDRAILLDRGRIAKEGMPEEIMDFYNAMLAERENGTINQAVLPNGKVQTTSGNGEARVADIVLLDENGEAIEVVNVGQRVTLRISVVAEANLSSLVIGYLIKDRLGQHVFGSNTHLLNGRLENVVKGQRVKYEFTFFANLGVGSYSVAVALHADDTHLSVNFEWRDLALLFNVVNQDKGQFVGSTWLPLTWECSHDR